MAITFDRRFLLVGHDNSHYVSVFDLETLEPVNPIRLATGDYAQAIAASGKAILAMTRDGGGRQPDSPPGLDDSEQHAACFARRLSEQDCAWRRDDFVANGRYILIAQPDGTLTLYDSSADAFTVSRKETTPLLGAYAASNFDQFVVGNALLNSSLVPIKRFDDTGKSSGFAFLDNQTVSESQRPAVRARCFAACRSLDRERRMIRHGRAKRRSSARQRKYSRGLLAPLASRNAIVALTTSGFTVFPWNFDVGAAPPRLDRIVNAADGTQPVAPGGLISVFGNDLSPVSQSSRQVPLPTVLGESCLTINGQPVPVMFVSPRQINAQLPFAIDGNTQLSCARPAERATPST